VNRQEKMRRVQHQIVFARLDRFRRKLHHGFFASQSSFGQPVALFDVFVAERAAFRDRIARLKIAVRAIDRGHRKIR
jgi:hypothetical protein